MPIRQEWRYISDTMDTAVKETINRILIDTDNVLNSEIRELTRLIVIAAKRRKPELVAEARDLVALLVEEHEITVRKEFEGVFDVAFELAFSALFRGLSVGLRGLTVA